MRAHAPRKKDAATFRRTATFTRSVNLGNVIFRGGTRF